MKTIGRIRRVAIDNPQDKRRGSVMSPQVALYELLQDGFHGADEGNAKILLELGLSPSIIRRVQNAPTRRRNRVCDLFGAHLSSVLQRELNNAHQQQRLEAILKYAEQEDRDEKQQDELIHNKAPRAMMVLLTGMSYKEFATRRALLQVTDRGRPRKLSENQKTELWNRWRAHATLPYAQRFLRVAQDIDLDLRTIWPILQSALGIDNTKTVRRRLTRPTHTTPATTHWRGQARQRTASTQLKSPVDI